MTLIESLALAALHGFSRFVPISAESHEILTQRFLHFPSPSPEWHTTFALGALIALTIYFIHDWASIFSSLIQVAVYRKRPMTLDERMTFFMLFCAAIPFAFLAYLLRLTGTDSLESLQESYSNWILAGLISGSLLLHVASRWSKKLRGLFDLGIADSSLLGFGQLLSWIPGVGGTLGILTMSQFRNYHWEAATKIACLLSLPFVAFETLHGFHSIEWGSAEPFSGTSWFQWGFTLLIAIGASFLAIRVLTDQIRQSGFGKLIAYRLILAAILAGVHFWA